MGPRRVLAGLAVTAPLAVGVALATGSVELTPTQLMQGLVAREGGLAATLVWELRLPRVLAAFASGAALALAGLMLQVLVRNPLAEPYALGVAGGAALAALAAVATGAGFLAMQGAAFLGALAATLLVFALGGGARWNLFRLLLTGVLVATGCGAGVSLILALSPVADARGMLFWLLGDLGAANRPGWLWAAVLLGGVYAASQHRALDVLAAGTSQARVLGVAVGRLMGGLFFVAALLTAGVVSQAGPIGFVGLIVPHALRLAGLTRHGALVPGAVLAGGSFLALADAAARSLAAPQELPVGALTAVIGVPVMLWLLRGSR